MTEAHIKSKGENLNSLGNQITDSNACKDAEMSAECGGSPHPRLSAIS
jgi:hypothetical protein